MDIQQTRTIVKIYWSFAVTVLWSLQLEQINSAVGKYLDLRRGAEAAAEQQRK